MSKSKHKQTFFSKDDYYLLRKHIFQFSKEICDYLDEHQYMSVLEVGPSSTLHAEDTFPKLNTSIISNLCYKKHIYYQTLDISPEAKTNYTGSVEDLSFLNETFDIVIMLSVLERVEDIFLVPQQLYNITKPKSLVFINTPFMFKIHGPTPDCWRLSEFGYKALFKNYFSIKSIDTYPKNEFGKNSIPLSLNVMLERL